MHAETPIVVVHNPRPKKAFKKSSIDFANKAPLSAVIKLAAAGIAMKSYWSQKQK